MQNDSAAIDLIRSRFRQREVTDATLLSEVLDSLAFIDLFLFLEAERGGSISLDDVVGCRTVGDLCRVIQTAPPGEAPAMPVSNAPVG